EAGGMRPIAGSEVKVAGRPLTLLARDERGYRNLAHLVTRARLERERGTPGLSEGEVMERSEGLHLLTGPASGEIAWLIRSGRVETAGERLSRWREVFGNRLAIEVQRHHVSGEEEALARALIDLSHRSGVPWVVTNEPRYLDAQGRWVHDLQT